MVRRLTGFSKYLEDVAFSPNGQFLVTAIPDNPVLFFRVSDWQTFQTASVPEGAQSLAVSPDGQLLAVGGAVGGPVRLYRFSDGTFLRTLPGNVGTALRMSFSPDGQILASTSRSAVNLWRIGDGELSRILEGEASPNKRTYSPQDIRDIAFSPDGKTLAAGSSAGKIFLWRLGDGELTRTFSASTGAILSLAFAPSGKLLASGDASGVIKLWQMP